jgi:hypothetical protein
MATTKLPDHVKVFIVQSLACFDSPTTVVEAVNQEFGIKIARQHIEKYDPTKVAGQNLSKKYRVIFDATRDGFIGDTRNIGWSHRATRLRLIQRVGEKAERMGNLSLALQAAEQAAKESGNAFTNRHELTGKDGKDLPAPAAPVNIFQLPDNGRG